MAVTINFKNFEVRLFRFVGGKSKKVLKKFYKIVFSTKSLYQQNGSSDLL